MRPRMDVGSKSTGLELQEGGRVSLERRAGFGEANASSSQKDPAAVTSYCLRLQLKGVCALTARVMADCCYRELDRCS